MKPEEPILLSSRGVPLFSTYGWLAIAVFAAVVLVLLPCLYLLLPPSHPLHVSAYLVTLLGKFYFSIITQALTFAFMLLFFRNETGFGGNNGFTDFKRILGARIADPGTRATLMVLTGIYLLGVLILVRSLLRSKLGRVLTAIRDSESRLMFSGYNPLGYKLFVWTLSAVLCGIAGALYVPQVGIINPGEMSPANSIEAVVWVAVGGAAPCWGLCSVQAW